jgi:hypothetical protein
MAFRQTIQVTLHGTEITGHTGEGMSESMSGDAFQACLFHKFA